MIKLTNLIREQKGSEYVLDTYKTYTGPNNWNIPEFNSKKTIPYGDKAESDLKKLGAKPFVYTGNEEEPPTYLLKVYRDGKLNYVLKFHSDGEVISQHAPDYTFKYENGIALYTEDGTEKIGMIEKSGTKAVLKTQSEFAAKEKTPGEKRADIAVKSKGEDEWSFSDIGHTVLDWAGFIPGLGDALDLINAIWYFIEGKFVDGFLSLIAVIPIVGSAIKGSVKVGMKAVPELAILLKNALKNPDAAADFWKLTKKNNILTAKQLESIAEYMGDTVKWMTKNKSGIIGKLRSISGNTLDASTVNYALKNLEDFLSNSAKSIDDLTKTANKASVLRPGAKLAAKVKGKTLANIGKSLISLGFFKPVQLDRMAKILSSRFSKQIISDPVKLNALIRTMPNAKKFNSVLEKIKQTASENIKTNPALKRRFDSLDVSNIDAFKQEFPQVYEQMAKTAVDFAKKNNNYFWLKFEDDSLNRIGSLLSTGGFGTEGVQIWKEIAQNFWKKSADILGDEAENVKEYLYPETIDGSPDAIIGPAIKQLIKKYLPGAVEPLKAARSAVANTIVKPVADVSGIAPKKDPYVTPKPLINLD